MTPQARDSHGTYTTHKADSPGPANRRAQTAALWSGSVIGALLQGGCSGMTTQGGTPSVRAVADAPLGMASTLGLSRKDDERV